MKMWQCAFCTLFLIICVWLVSYGIFRSENFINKAAIEVNIVQHNEEVKIVEINDTGKNEISRGKIRHHVPKVMLEFYENSKSIKKNGLHERHPDIVRSVIPTHGGSHNLLYTQEDSNHNHDILVFNVPNSNKDELFKRAELRVLTLIEIKSKLGIERQIKISLYNETTNEIKFLEEKHIYHTDNTWISFNVSHAVQTILNETLSVKNKILKFIITIKLFQQYKMNNTGILKLSLMPIENNLKHDYPVLLLFYASAKSDFNGQRITENGTIVNMRNKRYVEEDYEEETNKIWEEEIVNKAMTRKMKRIRNNCKKRSLYIDFAEIQYDSWIVQPSGYESYQCAGKCFYPVSEHLSPTKHAIVQALLHSVAPTRVPRSCCVPTKLDSISVLYVDGEGVLTYRYAYKDMVVTECGCR